MKPSFGLLASIGVLALSVGCAKGRAITNTDVFLLPYPDGSAELPEAGPAVSNAPSSSAPSSSAPAQGRLLDGPDAGN